ncbi:hypothetical protein WR25_01924 [Diploscapter pachys]|uniref:Polycystin cation channel PKD1/PKD2 domain-containing protein n=1 Tax=Diploscapter pachys TaxID=2018661 RepID=A0A2A2JQY5_9BILA|nr:hypothetical protein WR25_01924 [Diploscapter pachys]
MVNLLIALSETFYDNEMVTTFFGYSFTFLDGLLGIALAIFVALVCGVLPFIMSKIMNPREVQMVEALKSRDAAYKYGFSATEDAANAFFRRFLVMLVAWVLVAEPFKAVLVAYYILKKYPDHLIISSVEKSIYPPRAPETFEEAPPGQVNSSVGSTIADLIKLKTTQDRRMRDEQLFETARQVIFFFISLYIIVSLTYYCRDRYGYYYQKQVRGLLALDPADGLDMAFTQIATPEDFYNWAKNSLATALRVSWYDDQPAWGMRGFLNDKVSRAMGIGTIRQVRSIENGNCRVEDPFVPYFDGCEGDVNGKSNEDRRSQMAPGWILYTGNGSDLREEYTYKDGRELQRFFLPTAWVESVRLIKYREDDGSSVLTFEILYVIYSVVMFVKETAYFIYFRYMVFKNAPRTRSLRKNLYNLATNSFTASNGNAYINLSSQRDMELAFRYCLAGVVFFASCKMIRILRFNRRIGVLAATLDNAAASMAAFAIVFVIIFVSFNLSLYTLLWFKVESYKDLIRTFETTIAGMLGKFVVSDIFQISPLGSIIFVAFMYTGTLILLNIYVMIIMHEFEQVRNDSSRQTNDYEIIEHVQSKIMRKLGLLERSDLQPRGLADSQKDYRNLEMLLAKVNLLYHRVHTERGEPSGRTNFNSTFGMLKKPPQIDY